jgi:hypothetical protein
MDLGIRRLLQWGEELTLSISCLFGEDMHPTPKLRGAFSATPNKKKKQCSFISWSRNCKFTFKLDPK